MERLGFLVFFVVSFAALIGLTTFLPLRNAMAYLVWVPLEFFFAVLTIWTGYGVVRKKS